MNVEIGTEAAQFPEKEFINGIFVTVRYWYSLMQKVAQLRPIDRHNFSGQIPGSSQFLGAVPVFHPLMPMNTKALSSFVDYLQPVSGGECKELF
jgi:hypothetical protein